MTVTPSDLDILHRVIERRLSGVHTCMPGEVVKVHAGEHALQFVDVQPSLQHIAYNEDDEEVHEALPLIHMCPVAYPRGGPFFMSWPLAVGDIVTVSFAERSIDEWIEKARKGGKRTILSGDPGVLHLNGAIVMPIGPGPRHALLQSVHAQNLVIGVDGGDSIHVTPAGEVRVGGAAAAQAMMLGTAHVNALDTLITALEVYANAIKAIADPTGGNPATTALLVATNLFQAHLASGALSAKHKVQ